MTSGSIGVAVIGGGMAGRAHAAGYRTATTLFGTDRPDVRLVAIADTNAAVADDTAKRYGYDRAEYDWHAIADAPDIDAVSVVVANHLHREIVEGLLAAGKHVLCEKPLAGSLADAEAMVAAAERSDRVTAVGYTYRRSPAVEAIRRELAAGTLGELVHFNGRYWCDYALDPTSPITWRYRGGPGTGALADVGSHLLDLSEFICGPIAKSAARPSPRSSPVAPFPSVSPTATPRVRSATSLPRWKTRMSPLLRRSSKTAVLERFPRPGWRTTYPTVWPSSCSDPKVRRRGICTAPANSRSRPTMSAATSGARGGCSSALSIRTSKAACRWTRAASGTAWPTYSPTRPARFLDQIAGIGELGPLPGFDEGLRGLRLVAAVAESADSGGAVVKVA